MHYCCLFVFALKQSTWTNNMVLGRPSQTAALELVFQYELIAPAAKELYILTKIISDKIVFQHMETESILSFPHLLLTVFTIILCRLD